MKTCETCANWSPAGEWEKGYGFGLGRCSAALMLFNVTEWSEDGESRKFIDEHKDKKAFVQDASDYVALLLTKPDFGCISHIDSAELIACVGGKP